MQKNNRPNGLLFFFVLVGLVNLVVLVISSSAILVTPLGFKPRTFRTGI